MTYTPIKPDAGPSPLLDAPKIQTNFSQYAAIFSSTIAGINYNHTALNDANQGNHEVILLQRQTTDPTVEGNETILYCKNATSNAGTQPQLFLRIPTFLPTQFDARVSTNTPMQLTYNEVNTAGPVYQSFLVGGYLIYFGTVNAIPSTVTLAPAPTSIVIAIAAFQKTLIPNNVAADIRTQILNTSQFQINSTTPPAGPFIVSYVAIGKV